MLTPSLFDGDDQGHGVLLQDAIAEDQLEAARSAALSCPEQAISIIAD